MRLESDDATNHAAWLHSSVPSGAGSARRSSTIHRIYANPIKYVAMPDSDTKAPRRPLKPPLMARSTESSDRLARTTTIFLDAYMGAPHFGSGIPRNLSGKVVPLRLPRHVVCKKIEPPDPGTVKCFEFERSPSLMGNEVERQYIASRQRRRMEGGLGYLSSTMALCNNPLAKELGFRPKSAYQNFVRQTLSQSDMDLRSLSTSDCAHSLADPAAPAPRSSLWLLFCTAPYEQHANCNRPPQPAPHAPHSTQRAPTPHSTQ